jgi:hypothetical protein
MRQRPAGKTIEKQPPETIVEELFPRDNPSPEL